MRITIKQIAQELGISHSTVSRVLNEKQSKLVSEATRDRIMEAANRLGYRPSRIAQALQGKGTQLVGVLVPDTEDYFFQTVLKHLRHTLEESEYELMVFVSPATETTAKWQRLLEWDLDGVFVFDYLFYVDGLWKALTQYTGTIPPIVGLFSSETQLQDFVTVDFQPAMTALLERWQQQGRTRPGYMAAAPSSFTQTEQRYTVFTEYACGNGMEPMNIPTSPAQCSLMEAARLGLHTWLTEGKPMPDALFCQNDEIALGAYRALREKGIAIPAQVALAGCDDLPYVSYLETPLTSLSLPVQEVCRRGWSILQKRMAEPEGLPMQVVLEASLRLRASCL